jgi:hypothetical protein
LEGKTKYCPDIRRKITDAERVAEFEVLGDLQTHILLEHHQKGDIPEDAEAA